MTQPLIEKLQYLDTVLHDIRQRYAITYEELQTLKNSPQPSSNELSLLQQQLNDSQHAYEQSIEQKKQLQQTINKLDADYQALAEAHHNLNDDYLTLQKKYHDLEQSNLQQIEKNRLAKEKTKLVMQRLTLIDQVPDT